MQQTVYNPEDLGISADDISFAIDAVKAPGEGKPSFIQLHGDKLAIVGGAAALAAFFWWQGRRGDDDE